MVSTYYDLLRQIWFLTLQHVLMLATFRYSIFFVWTLVTFATSCGQIFNISDLSEASNFQLKVSAPFKWVTICLTKIIEIIWTRQYFLKRHQCVLNRQTKWHHLAIFRGHSSPVHSSGRTVTTLILKRDYDLTMPACHYFINPSQCRSLGDQVSKKYFQKLDACRTFQLKYGSCKK